MCVASVSLKTNPGHSGVRSMRIKLLKKLRKLAKEKIRLYQMSERVYKITNPYCYQRDIFTGEKLDSIKERVIEERRKYILTQIYRIRKEKQNYPILINF